MKRTRNAKKKQAVDGKSGRLAEGVAHSQANGRSAPVERVGRWPIDKLLPYARNPKTHPPAHVDLIAKSMERFGQAQLVLVDGDEGPAKGEVIAGHGRVLAAQQLGWTELMVGEAVGWSEDEKKAYRIADNEIGSERHAPWDMALLKVELGALSLAGFEMPLIGFDNMQLKQFFAGKAGEADPEEAPELSPTPVVKMGEVWLLGDHRLLCGDCTKAEDVARLLGEAKPHLMVTDPPYGVNYDGGVATKKKRRKVDGDDGPNLFAPALKIAARHMPAGAWYIWHAGREAVPVYRAISDAGFEVRSLLIWNKLKAHYGTPSAHYCQKHEPMLYAVRGNADFTGPSNECSVWDIDQPSRNEFHPTQKPVECMVRAVRNHGDAGACVYDPFVGSGTTIIAAEMMARHCLAIDINPGYCQVTIERWQNFTGKKAILDGDGRDFDTIKAERLPTTGRLREVDRGVLPGDPEANGKRRPAVGAKRKGRRGGGPSVAVG